MRKAKFLILPLFILLPFACHGTASDSSSSSSALSTPSSSETELEEVSIKIDQEDTELLFGEELQLTYQLAGASHPHSVVFTSTDPDLVAVDENGLVTAGESKVGSAFIRVYLADDASVSDQIRITVKQRVRVKSITCSSTSMYLSKDGGSIRFTYQVLPGNATDKRVTISITDPSIAELDAENTVVKALKPGNTTLVIRSLESFSDVELTVPITVNSEGYVELSSSQEQKPDQIFNIRDVCGSRGVETLPSTGQRDVLVVPIGFSDIDFDRFYGNGKGNDGVKADLEKAFNGSGSEDTGYWESVSSYFAKSSFGRLDLQFTIADPYISTKTAAEEVPIATSTFSPYASVSDLVQRAVSAYSQKSGDDLTRFDSDSDGLLDSVWAIYAPVSSDKLSSGFGTYTYLPPSSAGGSGERISTFSFASVGDLFSRGAGKLDTHSYIHETGHMFGLNDYYNYTQYTSPLGMLDMQDLNVGDHNVYTKMLLGWVDPIIYSTDQVQTAKIHLDGQTAGASALLITDSYRGTSFDEYYMVEFYRPDGLNALDSQTNYYQDVLDSYEGTGQTPPDIRALPKSAGVKMYHVDSRLVTKAGGPDVDQVYYDTAEGKPNTAVAIGASNTSSYSRNRTRELFDEISLISSNSSGGKYLTSLSSFTAGDLFQTGSTFDPETFKVISYRRDGRMDSGKLLNIKVTYQKVSADGADILIEPLH